MIAWDVSDIHCEGRVNVGPQGYYLTEGRYARGGQELGRFTGETQRMEKWVLTDAAANCTFTYEWSVGGGSEGRFSGTCGGKEERFWGRGGRIRDRGGGG